MDDAERAFRDALHRVDSVKIPVPSLEPADVRRTPGLGLAVGRWLAAAAVLAVVAGLSVWVLSGRGATVTAVPAAPPSSPTAAKLTGTTWMAVQLYGKPTAAAPDQVPFLVFSADATFDGGDPCNGVGGSYRQVGEELRLTPGAMTEIGCNSDQQTRFHKALENTRRAVVDAEGYLELLDLPGNVLAIFQSSDGVQYPEPTPTIPPTADPDTPTGSLPTPVGSESAPAVQIRIRNASGVDFTDVHAEFASGEKVDYGPVPAGSASAYEVVELAYSSTYLEVVAGGKTYKYQPIDFMGESELPIGRYSYALDLVGSGIDLKLEFG
ncbi:MAG TPA: META domain-containing protein [Propionicimonas sp.]|jgi:heat shock protein HslJ|uniref:META domain-containing protein n=1 Tax=Propionicimonas sp. TaxID=1955623 RepID=UPI002F41C751